MNAKHIIGLVIVAIGVAAIVILSSDFTKYASFKEASANEGKQYKVVGHLTNPDQMEYNPLENANLFTFFLKDEEGLTKQVVYNGAKPQDFDRSEKIVLTGAMDGEEFHAKDILLKCPSKYVDDEIKLKEANLSTN